MRTQRTCSGGVMEFLSDIGLFTLKTIFIAGAIVIVAGLLFQMGSHRGRGRAPRLEVDRLNDRFRSFRRHLQSELLSKKQFKKLLKGEKKSEKKIESRDEKKPRLFVLDFDGDIRATQVESLREEITAILSVAEAGDELLVKLESGGGLVHAYGLAASQLSRIRRAQVKLTIAVDKVAASGGYMMACVGDRILAAPFSVIGSIGVIAQVPNLSRVLKKHDIDYREVTAGQFKRTVTVFGEITEPGMAKFKEQIEETHRLFKAFIKEHRPQVDLERVATGEHWYATDAIGMGLVDEIITSDEYVAARFETTDIFQVRFHTRRKWIEKFTESAASTLSRVFMREFSKFEKNRFGL